MGFFSNFGFKQKTKKTPSSKDTPKYNCREILDTCKTFKDKKLFGNRKKAYKYYDTMNEDMNKTLGEKLGPNFMFNKDTLHKLIPLKN